MFWAIRYLRTPFVRKKVMMSFFLIGFFFLFDVTSSQPEQTSYRSVRKRGKKRFNNVTSISECTTRHFIIVHIVPAVINYRSNGVHWLPAFTRICLYYLKTGLRDTNIHTKGYNVLYYSAVKNRRAFGLYNTIVRFCVCFHLEDVCKMTAYVAWAQIKRW